MPSCGAVRRLSNEPETNSQFCAQAPSRQVRQFIFSKGIFKHSAKKHLLRRQKNRENGISVNYYFLSIQQKNCSTMMSGQFLVNGQGGSGLGRVLLKEVQNAFNASQIIPNGKSNNSSLIYSKCLSVKQGKNLLSGVWVGFECQILK